jgi:hypothetical protein
MVARGANSPGQRPCRRVNADHADPVRPAEARAFIDEVVRTGLMLTDMLSNLLEALPEDAFPGEEPADVLLGMLAGSIHPVTVAAGRQTVESAMALLGAVSDKAREDLRAAAELARRA